MAFKSIFCTALEVFLGLVVCMLLLVGIACFAVSVFVTYPFTAILAALVLTFIAVCAFLSIRHDRKTTKRS